jgi:hypothetical protein
VVTLATMPEDSAIVRALGWPAAPPGVEVVLRRIGSTQPERSVLTDASGRVTFENLLPGSYEVSAVRRLESGEIQRLDAADRDVTAFAGGRQRLVDPPGDSLALPLAAGRRGSLVFSEVFAFVPDLPDYWYEWGIFIEVYNNSDTMIHLGDKVLAAGFPNPNHHPQWPCAALDSWRLDPAGIWTPYFVRFPGGPGAHPLAPGAAVVIAIDAIDHRPFHPQLLDLRRADFESVGWADVDNPAVPNLIDIGPRAWDHFYFGRGIFLYSTHIALALVDRINEVDLVTEVLPNGGIHQRIPLSSILDLIIAGYTPEEQARKLYPYCQFLIHPDLDRQPAYNWDYNRPLSLRRRPLLTLPDGRVVLQRTRTSARDWEVTAPSPGRVP